MSEAAPRRSRFWLIASLCLNLFLIGLIVAGLVVARNRMIAAAIQGGEGATSPEIILQMLPRSGAVKMCEVLVANVEGFRTLGRELVDARREMFRAFRAAPFDFEAFKTAQARVTRAQVGMVELRNKVSADVTARLDAGEREEFARQIARRYLRPQPARRASLREQCIELGAPSAESHPR